MTAAITVFLWGQSLFATTEVDSLLESIQQHCVDCHGAEGPEAGVRLDRAGSRLDLLKDRKLWERALRQIRDGAMPPEDATLSEPDRDHLASRLHAVLHEADWRSLSRPGRLPLARVTAIEYRNSIRDIFGVDLQVGTRLPDDPEGQTGFSNDRSNLLIAASDFELYLGEAERAVDTLMGLGRASVRHRIEAEQAWANQSDKSVDLIASGEGVLIKDTNAPFSFPLMAEHSGLYEIELLVRVQEGEPNTGMTVFLDGQLVTGVNVLGRENSRHRVRLRLPAGASTMTLGFAKEYATLVQPEFEPRRVPAKTLREIERQEVQRFETPGGYPKTRNALKAFDRMNEVIEEMTRMQRLCEKLVSEGRVDYEVHQLGSGNPDAIAPRPTKEFRSSKVPLNLSAGKVAQLLGVPQKQLEKQIRRETGFAFDQYAKAVRGYITLRDERHPERAKKVPGKVVVDAIEMRSLQAGDLDPVDGGLRDRGVGDRGPSWIFAVASDASGAKEALRKLAERAYGRPASEKQIDGLMNLYQAAIRDFAARRTTDRNSHGILEVSAEPDPEIHRQGLRDAMVGLLVSPSFLLRFSAEVSSGSKAGAVQELDAYELASRLSHFLWLSVPDDELRSCAEDGSLKRRQVLLGQVRRMLQDPRFDAACEVFARQWLNTRNVRPGDDLPPALVDAMHREPALMIRDTFRHDESLLDWIDGSWTYLNETLAKHYGIEGVVGSDMRRTSVSGTPRGGLLSTGAMLVSTSTNQRTSPVARGAWVVEVLLGQTLPLPPPSVPELKTGSKSMTVREQLELHRRSSQCASCHNRIDPYGFPLESFDRLGVWRTRERGGAEVDPSTELEDGTPIEDFSSLKDHLRRRGKDEFLRNVVERLFEFALGRELRYYDEHTVLRTLDTLHSNGYRGQALIEGVVTSAAFLKQDPDE